MNALSRPTAAMPVRLVLAAAVVALAVGAPRSALADAVVAKVDGTEIHESDLKLIEEEIGSNLPPSSPEQRRDVLISYAADILLVARAAEAKKLQDTPEFKAKMAHARNRVLMQQLMEAAGREAATESNMRRVYDESAKALGEETEVRARHILVESEDQAKDLARQARGGADFAELAKKNSKDPGASDGGDLGYFTKDQMVPEFAEVAFKTAVGQIADPVKTQFGWHVIKVEDQRKRQAPKYEDVKEQIEQFVQRKAQSELVTKLRAGVKIERIAAPAPKN